MPSLDGLLQRGGAVKQTRLREADEIHLLNEWIDAGKPLPGAKPPPPSRFAEVRLAPRASGEHPEYGVCTRFDELLLSNKTKNALRKADFTEMSEIQRASLPDALCFNNVSSSRSIVV